MTSAIIGASRPEQLDDTLAKGQDADIDAFNLQAVLVYRTLVLRRSPLAGRPPAPYRLIWTGRYYEVWQRRPSAEPSYIEHPDLRQWVVIGPGSQLTLPVPTGLAARCPPGESETMFTYCDLTTGHTSFRRYDDAVGAISHQLTKGDVHARCGKCSVRWNPADGGGNPQYRLRHRCCRKRATPADRSLRATPGSPC